MNSWVHVALTIGLLVVVPAAEVLRELIPGARIPRELTAGRLHTYRLTLAHHDVVRITIEQRGIDVVAALLDPDGREVVAVNAMDDEFRPGW